MVDATTYSKCEIDIFSVSKTKASNNVVKCSTKKKIEYRVFFKKLSMMWVQLEKMVKSTQKKYDFPTDNYCTIT